MKFLNVLYTAKTGLFLGAALGIFLPLFTEWGAPNINHVVVKLLLIAVFLTATFRSDEDLKGDWEVLTADVRKNLFELIAAGLFILALEGFSFAFYGKGIPMTWVQFEAVVLLMALSLLMSMSPKVGAKN